MSRRATGPEATPADQLARDGRGRGVRIKREHDQHACMRVAGAKEALTEGRHLLLSDYD